MRCMDSSGVEMIPIRLVISIAVIGLVVALWAFGMKAVQSSDAVGILRGECEGLAGSLAGLVRGGMPRDLRDPCSMLGTRRVVEFVVPKGCVFVSFGGDPDPDGDGVLTSMVTGSGAVIVFQVQGVGKTAVWLSEPVGFRAGVLDDNRYILGPGSLVVEDPGVLRLVFELVWNGEERYILIYSSK